MVGRSAFLNLYYATINLFLKKLLYREESEFLPSEPDWIRQLHALLCTKDVLAPAANENPGFLNQILEDPDNPALQVEIVDSQYKS